MSCLYVDNKIGYQIKIFIKSIDIIESGCWEWKRGLSKQGYALFYCIAPRTKQRLTTAHRFSYELFIDAIPNGLMICHRCDNPKCVNPDHLFAGTQDDNMKDKVKKGRQIHGPKMHNAKLNWDLVRLFREEYKNGTSAYMLAKKYKYAEGTICDVVKNRSWRNDPNGNIPR